MFTIVNGALLRELRFEGADRIVSLGVRNLGNAQSQGSGLSYADFQDWRTAQHTFEGIGAAAEDGVDVSDNDRPAVRVRGRSCLGTRLHSFGSGQHLVVSF